MLFKNGISFKQNCAGLCNDSAMFVGKIEAKSVWLCAQYQHAA